MIDYLGGKDELCRQSIGQTLALAEPEARLYNHQTHTTHPPTHPQEQMFVLAISQPFLNEMS